MKYCILFLCALLLCGCSSETTLPTVPEATPPVETTAAAALPPETLPPDPIREILDQMSLEQRVGQLFLARCDDAYALEHIETYHLGGFVLFQQDFRNETPGDSAQKKFARYQAAAKIPLLLAVDEEGGTVTRVSSS